MRSLYLLLVTAFIFSITADAQDWVKMMRDPNVNFYDIQKEFNREWKEKEEEMLWERSAGSSDESEEEELEGGYMPYKRWEYFMEPRVYPSGQRLNPNITWTNYQAWLAANAKQNKGNKIQGASNWTIIGPVSQGCAGRVNTVQFHPANSNLIYAGGANGGLWISQNGGSTWNTNTDQLGSLGISDLAIDPVNNNIMYLATGDNDHADANSIGILKSTDGGVTWNATGLSYTWPQGMTIGRVIIDPTNTSILLASTSSGIVRSTNAGSSWTQVISGNFDDVVFNPGNHNIIYASTYGGYYRSSNNGVTFSTVSGSGLPSSGSLNRLKIAVTGADSNYVYIVTGNGSTSGLYGFYLSKDKGLTFTLKANSPNLLGSQSWYATAIGASPVNKGEVVVGGLTCYRSTDEGVTWAEIGGSIHVDYHAVMFSPNGATIMVGNDGGAYKSTNGGSNWTSLRPGLQLGQSYGVGISAKNTKLLITGLQDNGTYDYDGTTWTHILGGDGMLGFIDWSNDNYMFGSAQNGDLNRSADGGANFSSILGTINEPGAWVTPWMQDPNVANTIYAGMINLWKSPDKGTTWTKISSFSSSGSSIHSLAVAPSNSNYIYVGKYSYLYRSMDGGATWSTITGTLPVGSASISSISVSYTDPKKVWVTFSGYSANNKVFQSIDAGATWTNCASSSLPNLPVDCSVYQNGTNDGVYIGMDIGVYYKDATLGTWQAFNTGFPNVWSSQLQVNYLTGKLVSSTFGRGIWHSDLYSPGAFPPNAVFTASASAICTPQAIHFTDETGYNPTTWSWSFGDGNTSSSQNPIHTYTANGTYTVKLVVTNSNGADSTTTTVAVNIPSSPSAIPASRCGSGTLNLGANASGSGTLNWYDSVAAVMPIGIGTSYTTPVINSTTTYYVEEKVQLPVQHAGPVDNTFGTGGNFNNNSDRRNYFDVFVPCTLQTVKVYASGAANRTIEVWDAAGVLKNTLTVNIPSGTSTVALNFPLSPGIGYYIKANGNVNLYRNDAGASFPYTLPGVISITGTDAGDNIHYYYFYDWTVQVAPCISSRVPVTATILFATPVISSSGDTLISSAGNSYQWYLDGNAIPGATGQSYIAITGGAYTVEVTGNGCTIMSDPFAVISLGTAEAGGGGFVIYPNPAGDRFEVSGLKFDVKATLDIYTVLGEKIYSQQIQASNSKPKTVIDISSFSKGVYFVQVTTEEGSSVKRVVKE